MRQPLDGLRRAREAAGLSQAAAGRIIGRTQSHFAKIERGAVGLDVRDAVQLAQALGVTVESLLQVTS